MLEETQTCAACACELPESLQSLTIGENFYENMRVAPLAIGLPSLHVPSGTFGL